MRLGQLLIALLVLAAASGVEAQPEYRYKVLHGRTGLRHDKLNVFFGTDTRGFHWIGSSGGPYRFDGQEAKLVAPPVVQGGDIASGSDFFEDAAGHLWSSTGNGLVRYAPEEQKYRSYPLASPADGLGWHLFHCEAEAGQLWMSNASSLRVVSVVDPSVVHARADSKAVRYLRAESSGDALFLGFPWWLAPGLERIRSRGAGSLEVTASKDPQIAMLTLNAGCVDRAGHTWLSSTVGLVAYDAEADKYLATYTVPGAATTGIWDVILVDSLLLVATAEDGLWWFHPERKRFWRKLNPLPAGGGEPQLASTNRPRVLHRAPDGAILVARASGGVDVLTPSDGRVLPVVDHRAEAILAQEVAASDNGEVYVAAEPNRVLAFDRNGDPSKEWMFDGEVSARTGKSIAVTSDGTVWHARDSVLYALTSGSGRWSEVGRLPGSVRELYPDGTNVLLFTTAGLYTRRAGQFVQVGGWPRRRSTLAQVFAPGAREFILSEPVSPLRRFRLQTKNPDSSADLQVQLMDTLPAFVELQSAAYVGGGNDTILLGGLGAAVRFGRDEQTGAWVAVDTPIVEASVEAIAPEGRRLLWALTDQGLLRASGDRVRRTTTEHGLPSLSGIANTLAVAADGSVWAGTRRGLVRYAPRQTGAELAHETDAKPGRVYLQAAWIDDRPADPAALVREGGVTVGAKDGSLQLSLGTVGIYDRRPPRFSYRLVGLDERWQPVGRAGELSLSRLPPGAYALEVRAEDAAGSLTAPLSLRVVAPRPYYESWWFWLTTVLAAGAGVGTVSYIIYRRRLARERAEYERRAAVERERGRIAGELHDHLSGDLSTIVFLSEAEDDTVMSAEEQAQIKQLGQGAIRSLRDIMRMLNTEPGSWSQLSAQLRALVMSRCAARGVEASFSSNVSEREGEALLTEAALRHTVLIVKEAINNALRHSGARHIHVTITEGVGAIAIAIEDDGSGIGDGRSTSGGGSGLASMRQRAEQLRGKLDFADRRGGSGTVVRLELPRPTGT